jgi:hypothetical protein
MTKQEREDLLAYADYYRLSYDVEKLAPRGLALIENISDEWLPGDSWADIAESLAYEWTDGP